MSPMRAVLAQGGRCWRCSVRLCAVHTFCLAKDERFFAICSACMQDVHGTIAALKTAGAC